jgi:hypothetical protein
MWAIMTMHETQVSLDIARASQETAKASKRDSSIMMGITVGTLTFLPATAIAVSNVSNQHRPTFNLLTPLPQTIFAMPVFNWDAEPGKNVADKRFWIFCAVAFPLTALTLLILFAWMALADTALQNNTTVRAVLQRGWTSRSRSGLPDYKTNS